MEDKGYGLRVKKICEEYKRNNPKASDDEVSLLRDVSESFYRKKPEQRKKILETKGLFQNFEKFRKVFEEHD